MRTYEITIMKMTTKERFNVFSVVGNDKESSDAMKIVIKDYPYPCFDIVKIKLFKVDHEKAAQIGYYQEVTGGLANRRSVDAVGERYENPFKAMYNDKCKAGQARLCTHEWICDYTSAFVKKDYFSCKLCGKKKEDL